MARLFKKEETRKPTSVQRLTASQVIRPEEAVSPVERRKTTTSRPRPDADQDLAKSKITTTVLHDGTTHISFGNGAPGMLRAPEPEVIDVRDPVTRRITRKKITRGIKRTREFYKTDGTLIIEPDDE